jgi:DNA-binding winged helix-turn-helix (wHTH) protein/tetratricopeptide (TPR) repeat protein
MIISRPRILLVIATYVILRRCPAAVRCDNVVLLLRLPRPIIVVGATRPEPNAQAGVLGLPDRWTYNEDDQSLICGDRQVRLGPKAGTLLACLLRRKGQLVTHSELLAEVWGSIDVSPDLVREYVFDLRSALGDNARRPRYLETVRGRGVRLFGNIDLARAKGERRRAKLHVMAPIVLGGDHDAQADSVTEDLIHCVAAMTDIAVVGYEAQSDAEPVAADYAVATRITFEADRMVVRFRLVETASRKCIWSRRFEGPAHPWTHWAHVAAVAGNEIASWRGAIIQAEATKARMLPSGVLGGYQHYALALDYERRRDPAGAEAARHHIERSLEIQPENARGWLLLWHILERPFILFGEPLSQERHRRCADAIARAYALAPDDAQILANICGERARVGDLAGAVIALDRAAEIGRMQADAMSPCANAYATVTGDIEAARAHLAHAHSLNPTVKDWLRFATVRVAFFSGDFAACEAATDTEPRLLPLAIFRTLALAMQSRKREASAAYRSMRRNFPKVDFDEYAARLPIAAPAAKDMYDEAIRRLQVGKAG